MKSQVSKLIPKGKGYNIAEFYKNGKSSVGLFIRYAKEALANGVKSTMIQRIFGTGQVLGVIVETGGIRDPITLYMPCKTCDKWLGDLEEDNLKILDGMCIECFTEEIEQ